jgi:cyclic beta-1,2-glucan synthetase
VKSKPIQDFLSNLRISFLGDNLMRKYANEKPPLRSELFTAEQMEQYAKKLAGEHVLDSGRAQDLLLKRLAENEELLLEVHNLLTESAKANSRIAPAGEWLLDNFYLIEEQIYTGKKHLPKGYSEGLPWLSKGLSAGLPRVYDIALEIISHSDGRVDLTSLTSFVEAYQEVTKLKLGELWAIPIMVRLALIENLRRLAAQLAIDRINKNLADYWADEMTETAEKDPKSLVLVIADMARSSPPMVSSFVAELTRRLLGKGPALALPLTWIEQRLSENGQTSNELVDLENQKQAADQVSMSNSIGSLRFLSNTDWREFVEMTSVVEQILREDMGGIYPAMDFYTRDHYRHVVEKIAKTSSLSEQEVALIAIRLARESGVKSESDFRTQHVGFYLVDKGLRETEKLARILLPMPEKLLRALGKVPLLLYMGSVIAITLILSGGMFAKAWSERLEPVFLVISAILSILCTSHLAVTFVNWVATLLVKPNALPRMDFSTGIPPGSRTLVVVPAMLSNPNELKNLMEGLEVRFLANKNENLHFALLTDFRDATSESIPEDEPLLLLAKHKFLELNKKYGRERNDTFFIFHRPRRWNPREKMWMGYERKRGKLGELNALLRGKSKESFLLIAGEEAVYTKIKYLITLDTDTKLPRDAAWKITGTLSHPLNHALYDDKKKRVTEGYTILQPRVSTSLPGANSSLYTRMHGNEPGLDPYTRSISDVYQDLFREGSFIGKGIYDIDAFERTLNDRFPENRILSHDLLEGCYARSGLLTDVQLYEEYPGSYLADMKRRHRWIRGDWQIGRWLFPYVPGPGKHPQKNPLSTLSRWKIFDNLRRSLVPSALTFLLLFGLMISTSPWFWVLSIVGIITLTSVVNFIWEICRKPADVLLFHHAISSIRSLSNNFIQHLFTLICLPYEAFVSLDAIFRTNWRMFISRKRLLEWNPSNTGYSNDEQNLLRTYLTMLVGPVIAVGVFVYLTIYSPFSLLIASPILGLWIVSPAVAWWVSLPITRRKAKLTPQQIVFLQKLARKTWAYFENFVGEKDNWLPPDNYQESPVARIAHRTSPTNMGLSLLAGLSACDFGYLTAGQLIERTALTLKTMQDLEKYRGHFYNWYDTQTLLPMAPKYVSTVDSGNLAGHLLVLKQGLLSLKNQKISGNRIFEGLRDTLSVLAEKVEETDLLRQFQIDVESACSSVPIILETTKLFFDRLAKSSGEIIESMEGDLESESYWWAKVLATQSCGARDDLMSLAPWLWMPPVPSKYNDLAVVTLGIPTLLELSRIEEDLLPKINDWYALDNTAEENQWLDAFCRNITDSSRRAKERILTIDRLGEQCLTISNMDYDFLFDKSQNLLRIGYNVDEHRRDLGYYDLLASESRLGIFVAIAQGKIPQECWFSLGRQLTNTGISPVLTVVSPVLLSWSGSMFEYLMPLLVMPSYENTLLDQTNKGTVQKQIEYGKKRGVPWGISESGYNMVDTNLNYQYRAFGVPGLGLKRGLGEDLVIAPYASMMAMMVAPEESCKNLEKLLEDGFEGKFGFFEAVDYTPNRLPRGQSNAIVRSFMVHHQGMSLLSLAFYLLDQPMQKRFESETQFQATLLLLQERIPQITTFYSPTILKSDTSVVSDDTPMRVITTPNTQIPEIQLLSNGRYHVMVTNSGGGYSRWKDISVTRWREDCTCDNWGTFCFIRDLGNDEFWSSAFQPTLKQADNYEVIFSQGRAEFRRRDSELESHTEIVVSPEDDVEMRRIHITNRSRKRRYIEVTSYAEVVLNSAAADAAHPAFNNLFVQTEIIDQRHAILCTRRPRSVEERPPWMFHLMKVRGANTEEVSYETDRAQFIGRGNSIAEPRVMQHAAVLSGSHGSVLDPIVSIQYRIMLKSHETAIIDMVYGIGETREMCNGLIEKYQDLNMTDRAFGLAWTHSQVVLRQINATEADAQLYGRLASSVIFANPSLRADAGTIIKNHRGQSGLWSYSVSGDLPVVLLQIEDSANIELVKQLVQAHAYWRLKGLVVDLVIWNEEHSGYRQTLQSQILALIAPGIAADIQDRPGGIFIRSVDQISNEDRVLFQTVARVILTDKAGTLDGQINRRARLKSVIPHFTPARFYASLETTVSPPGALQFFNGTGGFSDDGKEYVIHTSATMSTPAPWVNVIANPNFGTVISESGQSYTWVENAHEMRLTPWNNDPVTDSAGENFYLRDEESGRYWSPMPLPSRGKSPYTIRHGFGYSVFEHNEDGIYSEICIYVDIEASIKFAVLKLRNQSGRSRRVSVTGYVEWVLADLRSKSLMYVVTEVDANTGALFARNSYNAEFGNRVAFFDVEDTSKTFTADREEFIGRNGTLKHPDAMNRARLSGKSGAALDPCAVLQVVYDLADEGDREVIFRLGTGRDANAASDMVRQFRGNTVAREALEKVKNYWKKIVGTLQIETPDKALNILTNGWLTYQTIASRLWARSGFYQSGGAFGFRDQLQDVLSILHTQPHLVKEQILLCASHQYKEGDVQHWWHPPIGRGVRTRCSDDFLWLPYVTSRYVSFTSDTGILDEVAFYLEDRLLNLDEEAYYDLPLRSDKSASLYEHCVKAIECGLKFGEHGLPLMGTGDWNDGMDKVGNHGKGESIWLAFFLFDILSKFMVIANLHKDSGFAGRCKVQADLLRKNISKNGWDGKWYRRAYFDNGTPLGSSVNDECKIDSIAQSWSVLSGAGEAEHSRMAMDAANDYLVRKDRRIIQLFDPPFDKSELNPGYIKGYVPGVRENGGQYTHAAIWLIMAFAALGDKERVWELLQMINPINHGINPEEIAIYRVEPYVMAADVYAVSQFAGRGGWTWYTGSAGWMYQLIVESFLGLRREGEMLRFKPCLPAGWESLTVHYRFLETMYHLLLSQDTSNQGKMNIIMDNTEQENNAIALVNDGKEHTVKIILFSGK